MGAACTSRQSYARFNGASPNVYGAARGNVPYQSRPSMSQQAIVTTKHPAGRRNLLFILSPASGNTTKSPPLKENSALDLDVVDRLSRNLKPQNFTAILIILHNMRQVALAKRAEAVDEETKNVKKLCKTTGSIHLDYWLNQFKISQQENKDDILAKNQEAEKEVETEKPLIEFSSEDGGEASRQQSATSKPAAPLVPENPLPSSHFDAQMTTLQERLELLHCRPINVKSDGNVLFRATSWHLFGSETHHRHVRKRVVDHMMAHPHNYSLFFAPETDQFESYIRQLSLAGNWGDELCIRAISDTFRCVIHMLTASPTNWYIRCEPTKSHRSAKHIFLTYIIPSFYDAFFTIVDATT